MKGLLRVLRWGFYTVIIVVVLAAAYVVTNLKSDMALDTLKARWTDKTSRFVEVDGMQVHYRDEGTGPAVVLLHGTSSSLHTWDGWTAVLRKNARIIRMDLPAFGLTGPNPSRDYGPEAYVAFLDRFVERVGLAQFALGGNSLGGRIAWKYTIKHPQKLRALILVDAAGYPVKPGSEPLAFRAANWPVLPELLVRMDPRSFVEDGVKKSYGDPSRIRAETLDRYYELTLRPGNRNAFIDRMRTPYPDESALIRGVRTPTLVLWGARDQLIPVDTAKSFERDIQGSRVIVYDDLGHIPMEEDAARTAADAAKFLSEHAPK
jgi:pimeloyl-ACP methyl ester carboxylesterase